MKRKFIGLDEPAKHENFFELFKDGAPYVSLYHDCKVTWVEFSKGGDFNVPLERVHDSGHGPAVVVPVPF